MKRTFYPIFVAILPLIAAIATPPATCLGGETGEPCCSSCSNGSNSCCDKSCGGCSYYWCKICNFHLVDGCTHYFWKRTWYGPDALHTPLRQYYVPRPPSCWGVDGYAWNTHPANQEQYYMPSCMDCEDRNVALATAVDHPADGFSPSKFERLGQIRNELDVVGTTTVRGAAPGH